MGTNKVDTRVVVEITGYGWLALGAEPIRVVQTGERIGRSAPTVAARAVAYAQANEWSALRRLARRSRNLHVSTGGRQGQISIGYGSACLAIVRDDRLSSGLGGDRALALLIGEGVQS